MRTRRCSKYNLLRFLLLVHLAFIQSTGVATARESESARFKLVCMMRSVGAPVEWVFDIDLERGTINYAPAQINSDRFVFVENLPNGVWIRFDISRITGFATMTNSEKSYSDGSCQRASSARF